MSFSRRKLWHKHYDPDSAFTNTTRLRSLMIHSFVVAISELQESKIFFTLRHGMQWVFFYDCLCDSLGRFTAALVVTSFASNRELHEFLFLRSLNHVVG
ncbi:uncharacterized protein isoform X2 [Bombus fervidus]|uniref:uncharacterized protein isoform X2 n=1 Tax=Bombus fervidus TaxID=203811 RepID=UPI003D18ACEA